MNLIPEKRLDKNGRLVTKHVSNRTLETPFKSRNLLSRLLPTLAASQNLKAQEREALEASIMEGCDKWFIKVSDRLRLQAERDPSNANHHMIRINMKARESFILKRDAIEKAQKYKDGTVRLINKSVSQYGLTDAEVFEKFKTEKPELHIREEFTYPELLKAEYSPILLDHVRASLRIRDTSFYADKDAASAVYKVALAARENRAVAYRSNPSSTEEYAKYQEQETEAETARPQMTRNLADLIMRHPDRTDEIISYMDTRSKSIPTDVSIEALEEYLNAPARSISEGAL